MKETIQRNWQGILATAAGVALVFGISILLFSPRGTDVIPDPDPEVIERNTFSVDPANPDAEILPSGPVVISPATISVQNASPGLRLSPINVQNQSTEERRVLIDFAPIYRTDSLGVPVILGDRENTRRGEQFLGLQPSGRVTIGPGEVLQIQPTLRQAPPKPTLLGSIGVTLLGKKGDLSDPEREGVQTQVSQDVRLSALLYAVFPGGTSDRVRLDSLRADPLGGRGRLRVMVSMTSEGDVPALASGVAILRDSSGRELQRPLIETTVLPGQKSSTSSAAFEGLRPGKYEMEARVITGGRGQSLQRSLLLDSRGLPAVAESSSTLFVRPAKTKPGRSISLDLRVRNTGEKSFDPEVKVSLFPYSSDRAVSSNDLPFPSLSPGDESSKEVVLSAPRREGAYTYVATIRSQSGEILEEKNASLTVGGRTAPEPGLWDRARDWLSDNPGGSLALGAMLTGVLLLLLLLALRFWGGRKA